MALGQPGLVPENELPDIVRFQAAARTSTPLERLALDFIPLPTIEDGPRPVMLASGFAMAAGIVGFGLAPGLWLSLPAALLVGAGCGNIYPLTMSMVGQLPAARPERNVATLALVAFTAFLIGPPLIGTLAHVVGLPLALALLAPLGLAPLALVPRPAASRGPQPQ